LIKIEKLILEIKKKLIFKCFELKISKNRMKQRKITKKNQYYKKEN